MSDQTQSPVLALLALPSIGGQGVEQSVVFANLPAQAQSEVKAAKSEARKRKIAAQAGANLPVIAQMHEDLIAGPKRRAASGDVMPILADLGDFPLPGVLRDGDRNWLRTSQPIRSIQTEQDGSGWNVLVTYADDQTRCANETSESYFEKSAAQQRHQDVQTAAYILGLIEQEQAAH